LLLLLVFCFLRKGLTMVAQVNLLLLQLPKCWDYKCEPPHPVRLPFIRRKETGFLVFHTFRTQDSASGTWPPTTEARRMDGQFLGHLSFPHPIPAPMCQLSTTASSDVPCSEHRNHTIPCPTLLELVHPNSQVASDKTRPGNLIAETEGQRL
jgi:hypothetical protein